MAISIFSLNLSNLKNKTHWSYNKMVCKAIEVFNVSRGKFKDFVDAYLAAFAKEDEETISGLPGSPMQPPINTVGYMWQPAPPRIIPTKDTTYREVEYVDDWK